LEAAAEVFSRRGFYAASVEEVAEAAGFSKGAVYSNFASKEELFFVLLDRHLEREFRNLERLFTMKRSPEAALAATREGSFAQGLEQGRAWNLLAMEFWLYAMRDERAREKLAARYHAARGELATHLRERYAAAGGYPPLPVIELAWGLLAIGSGLAIQAYLEPDALPDDLYGRVTKQLLASVPPAARGKG
jgi:AcrR family transcriptional regulator